MRGLSVSALFVTIFIMLASRRGGHTANHGWACIARFVASHTALGRHLGRELRLSFEGLEQRAQFSSLTDTPESARKDQVVIAVALHASARD